MFGSDDEKLEPATATRYASVFALAPSRPYLWRGTRNHSGFRLEVLDGGLIGTTIYNQLRNWKLDDEVSRRADTTRAATDGAKGAKTALSGDETSRPVPVHPQTAAPA